MKWIVVVLVLLALAFWLGVRWSTGRDPQAIAFIPVSELPPDARRAVERDLATGLTARAERTYRSATGSGSTAARAAIDAHRRAKP